MISPWKDAYDSQMETWRWVRSPHGREWRYAHYQAHVEELSGETAALIRYIYGQEEDKLLGADPFYVSREMCEVIAAASQSFEPEPLLPTDLLTESGFVYFEEPFKMPDRWSHDTYLGAFAWSPMIAVPGDVDLSHLRNRKVGISEVREIEGATQSGVALTLYARPSEAPHAWQEHWPSPPKRIPMHHTPWWFDMTLDGNEVDENGERTGVAEWWRVIQTSLRLMQQRIAVRHAERPDRATRRRGIAKGFHEREVVVVKLRREAGDGHHDAPEGDANYSHRFIVSGHWRNQWYPSANLHRQIWISPYVKGPEDQPLVVRPRRVFAMVR